MSGAREEILERIRAALADVAASREVAVPRDYRRAGRLDRETTVALFCERAGDYRASVTRCGLAELPRVLGEICAAHGASALVAPADVEWAPERARLVRDEGLGPAELDAAEGVVTGCALAIAETGTIILDGGPRQGRRALTLVPDLHVCVVEAEQIVETVPEAVERTGEMVRESGRPLTFVSGPSATSDIELSRVEGVHGPRRLAIVVLG